MSDRLMGRRALNRATLARQLLLERAAMPVVEAVEHLAGMQSQAPLAPYIGLWARLRDFETDDLSRVAEERAVARLSLMRNTVHLVSRRDARGWEPLFASMRAAQYRSRFRVDVDLDAVLARARALLSERPMTRRELGALLAERWPDADPFAMAYAVSHHLALCHVTPRGVWGRQGPAALAPLERWLGEPSSRFRWKTWSVATWAPSARPPSPTRSSGPA